MKQRIRDVGTVHFGGAMVYEGAGANHSDEPGDGRVE
jgi:hypothetical protein